MPHPFLSDEWLDEAKAIREKYAGQGTPIGHKIRMNQVITGVPFGPGELQLYMDTSGGEIVMEKGALPDADVTVTTDYETARKIFVDQDPQAGMQAFMSGKIGAGDMMKLMQTGRRPTRRPKVADDQGDHCVAGARPSGATAWWRGTVGAPRRPVPRGDDRRHRADGRRWRLPTSPEVSSVGPAPSASPGSRRRIPPASSAAGRPPPRRGPRRPPRWRPSPSWPAPRCRGRPRTWQERRR